jgi:predicted Zn-dependent protease with MMP-like domain
VTAPGAARARARRRDRHGRGLRSPLLPRDVVLAGRTLRVPAAQTRGERFDDLVLDAVEHLEQRWARELHGVEFAVEEVPIADSVVDLDDADVDDPVPLSRLQPASGTGRATTPPRIVLYRRPLEARATDADDLGDLILDVLIHEVAAMLDVDPEVVDPEGHGFGED